MEGQSVVVIQDASREASVNAMRWALHGLSLEPGDKLSLVAVLHQVNNPLAYKSKGDLHDIEAARRKEAYHNSVQLMQMSKLYHMLMIRFKVEVVTGPSSKVAALRAAQSLKPTWVILDRQMKKDRKYFLEKLSCGISRMKHNDNIELLRGPKTIQTSEMTYGEMLPGSPEEDDLFSIELFPTSQVEAGQDQDIFEYSRCSVCNNRRPRVGWKSDFKYAELEAATDGFSSNNSLSDYGFGPAYRGQLQCKLNIVAQLHKNAKFKSQVYQLSNIMHKNVINLLGSCTQGSHRLLVYEYACNGSLNKHLSKYSPSPLTWTERIKIATGAARGLHYLHENSIVHRDIRPSNILLTHDFEPLVGGFGIASMNYESKYQGGGTYGYIAPDYTENGKLSTKTDVYSFGVVLLELITGRNAADTLGEQSLVEWARPLLKDSKYIELIDPRIAESHNADQFSWIAQVARKCTSKNPKKRLPMDKVVSALECVIEPVESYEGKLKQESCGKKQVRFDDVINRSISLPSPANFSTSSSLGSSSSANSYRMPRARSGRPQLSYQDMLN